MIVPSNSNPRSSSDFALHFQRHHIQFLPRFIIPGLMMNHYQLTFLLHDCQWERTQTICPFKSAIHEWAVAESFVVSVIKSEHNPRLNRCHSILMWVASGAQWKMELGL